jgi:hypothetical protein
MSLSGDTYKMNSSDVSPEIDQIHPLSDKWTLWAHLPHDTNWSIDSYSKIHTIENMEESIVLCETLPEKMVKNCMLFLMKENIKPTWEDPINRNGGCFSYKITNKNVEDAWKNIFYHLIGNTISKNKQFISSITGITISPKKNFCIIKIWLSNCNYQNPDFIRVKSLSNQACLFKKHTPIR